MEILKYKEINKSALMGVFSLKLPKWGNFIIHDMSYFKKDNKSWVSFPSREYEKDGQKKYFNLNAFEDFEMSKKFLDEVKKVLELHLQPKALAPFPDLFPDENIPF